MAIEIRRGTYSEGKKHKRPFWTAPRDDESVRPVLRCKCGMYVSLESYQISKSGVITPEFFHTTCGWHVNLILKEYERGEFR